MTLKQFEKAIAKKQVLADMGLGNRIVFTMDRPKLYRPDMRKIRSPFGIVECYPSSDDGKILIWMSLKQAKSFLEKEKLKAKNK